MKILLLGNSLKFQQIIKKIYPKSNLTIVSWREINSHIKIKTNIDYDLILVCGYDFKSGLYNKYSYLKANIVVPYMFIKKNNLSKTKIVYINTSIEKTNYTFSRYKYAKFLLHEKLKNKFNNFYSISFNIIMIDEKINIYGSFLYQGIFLILYKFNVIKVDNEFQIIKKIKNKINKKNLDIKTLNIKPILIFIKRPLFFDRLIRLLDG